MRSGVPLTQPAGAMTMKPLAGIVSLGFFVASVASIVSIQTSSPFGVGDWPAHFSQAGTLMWVAIVLYGGDAVITAVERREFLREQAAQHRPAPPEQPEPSHPS